MSSHWLTPLIFLKLALAFVLGLMCSSAAQGQRTPIDLTVLMSHPDLDTQQRWGELLADVGADTYTMRSTRGKVAPEVKTHEGRSGTSYEIVGILQSDRLFLPGGQFSLRDKQKIRDLIQRIRDDGPNTALAEKMAFGMTAEQLVALQQDLSALHKTATAGKSAEEIVKAIGSAINTPIEIDPAARPALVDDEAVVADELESLSCGTALAAALRPLGLVAVPFREQGKSPVILIKDFREAEEHWPVGWPLEGAPLGAVPKMFEQQDADIINYKLKAVLDVISKTCEVTFLYDHNAIARHSADLNALVSFKQDRVSYYAVVARLLSQVRPQLTSEVRFDEAGTPFLWISTSLK